MRLAILTALSGDIPKDIAESVYVAGASLKEDKLVTSGGRVLGATAYGATLEEAIRGAYGLVDRISFEGAYFRHDIGARALRADIKK